MYTGVCPYCIRFSIGETMEILYNVLISSYEVWILWAKWNLRYAPETVFSFKVIVTLTFDLVTPKSIGVFYPILATILWSLNIVGQMELKLCSGNQIADERTDTCRYNTICPKFFRAYKNEWQDLSVNGCYEVIG
jgi:hypothetical protein